MTADLSGEVPLDERELIERARRGDGAAWEALVRRHQEPLFRLAYLHLGDAAEAEDVAQETFVRAFRALDGFDAARPLRPWLLAITANLARNRRRALGRYWAALTRHARAHPEAQPARSDPLPEGAWRARRLWQAVRRLRQADQEIVYLRFFLELPVEEAALALGVAPGTVKSRLHRALGRLREVIRRDFPDLVEEMER